MIRDGKIIGQDYREVATLPMPGFEASSSTHLPSKEGVVYKKTSEHHRRIPGFLEVVAPGSQPENRDIEVLSFRKIAYRPKRKDSI